MSNVFLEGDVRLRIIGQVLTIYASRLKDTYYAAAWDTVDRQTVEIITPKVCTYHTDETRTVFSIVESLILFL
jgi:hypothetical protein